MVEKLTEAQLKASVDQYLQYGMNMGLFYYDRLNSGSYFVPSDGNHRGRLIRGCRPGTADYMVLQKRLDGEVSYCQVIFLELKGHKTPVRKEQAEFASQVNALGAEYHLIRSLEELEKVLPVEVANQ
ncbi:hypothetical protein [Dehalococcoides mccartyi]|uniref:hypothetical protein n=1 Tax=Dehalococcoides mccartyi TaxID=61435 RepID=UPI0007506EDB|nr:hypothetical protein [Dehalococcoides mccartyi]